MLNATPAKLRDGSWGARVSGAVKKGDPILITTKAGKSWDALVDRVVWTDGKTTLVSTLNDDHATRVRKDGLSGRTTRREDEECELCGKNKYRCGHCIGW